MIEKTIKNIFRRFGLNLSRYTFYSSEQVLIRKCIDFFDIDTVIDVGANTGQYAMGLIESGFKKKIISFEPLRSAYGSLEKNARAYKNWEIHNLAVGSKEGELTINISENLASSSFLQVTDKSVEAAQESGFVGTESVNVITLDTFLRDKLNNVTNAFLKLDVQGFELEVLKGSESILHKVAALQIELSFVPLYEGGPLYHEVMAYMHTLGYEIYSIIPGFRNPDSGRMLQADGIFVRSSGR